MTVYDTDVLSEKLIDVVIRVAVGFKIKNFRLKTTSSFFESVVSRAIGNSSRYVVRTSNNQLYCNICGKGPYTRKGMYLHLLRMHKYEIKNIIREELRELESA
ncbi:MAG: hypothetical protein RMH84_04770 [Sulfolobales archaeon]|nr:C2H2-type zinc finger protein [Sulfolobales archaeon]MCX8208067.1 C2H2-type zinc finger protein [Sulfolobales archaeon]MDW8010888.1 hypothetical protein [Sulfolobales archaeon]